MPHFWNIERWKKKTWRISEFNMLRSVYLNEIHMLDSKLRRMHSHILNFFSTLKNCANTLRFFFFFSNVNLCKCKARLYGFADAPLKVLREKKRGSAGDRVRWASATIWTLRIKKKIFFFPNESWREHKNMSIWHYNSTIWTKYFQKISWKVPA